MNFILRISPINTFCYFETACFETMTNSFYKSTLELLSILKSWSKIYDFNVLICHRTFELGNLIVSL